MPHAVSNPNGFVYIVRAEFRDADVVERYIAWLRGGHIQGVIAAGAASGAIVRPDGAPRVVEAHYRFASRAAFDTYVAGPAEALRREGKEWMTGEGLVLGDTCTMTRTSGDIVFDT